MFLDKRKSVVIHQEKQLIYISVPKVACTSIKNAMFPNMDTGDNDSIHFAISHNQKIPLEANSYFKFTFVRNPFERLVSFYLDRVLNPTQNSKKVFKKYYNGIFNPNMNFDELVDAVSSIPDQFADRHFVSQKAIIYDSNNQCLADFIGKFENLLNDYKFIKNKYGLAELKTYNKSPNYNYKEFYTLKSLSKIYKRYERDVDLFGYVKQYEILKSFLESRN